MRDVIYSKPFSRLYKTLDPVEKYKINNFIATFQNHGLANFKNFQGKIAKSTNNLPAESEGYEVALKYCLWHYHTGHPRYVYNGYYNTSEYILHFAWDKQNMPDNILLVDYTPHKISGAFPIPPYT